MLLKPIAPIKNLIEQDKQYVWHPLTQHKTAAAPLGVVRAKGALFFDAAGNSYIDGIASWYTTMYGHANKTIITAITKQLKQLDFVMFSGFTHKPAVKLAKKLLDLLPNNQAKIFFNDNGSTAIEAAIKMALQYFFNKGEKRDTLIALEGGFHGDTFGAMSVSGLSSYNGPFEDFLLQVKRIPLPTDQNIDAVVTQLQNIVAHNNCAAFVYEPLVQGAAGMKFYKAQHLNKLLAVCKKADILCIADEIMTGFGKTETLFASEQVSFKPDIVCLSKALTAGMFPLSVTSCTQNIFDAFLDNQVSKGFFHAHTYTAHPVGCAAALAALKLLQSKKIKEQQKRIALAHKAFAAHIAQHPKVKNVRVKGVILAIDLDVKMARYGSLRDHLYQFFMQKGVNLRPLGNTVYTLPPFVITQKQLQTIYQTIEQALDIV